MPSRIVDEEAFAVAVALVERNHDFVDCGGYQCLKEFETCGTTPKGLPDCSASRKGSSRVFNSVKGGLGFSRRSNIPCRERHVL